MSSSLNSNGNSPARSDDPLTPLLAATIALLGKEERLTHRSYKRASRQAQQLLAAIPTDEPNRQAVAIASSVLHGLAANTDKMPSPKISVKVARQELQNLRRGARPVMPVCKCTSRFCQRARAADERVLGALAGWLAPRRIVRTFPLPVSGPRPAQPLSCN